MIINLKNFFMIIKYKKKYQILRRKNDNEF
jgi:hypothetical protein